MADADIKAEVEVQATAKSGYKTTEFWISVGVGVVGVVLLCAGKETLGAALLGVAGISYNGARGLAKLK